MATAHVLCNVEAFRITREGHGVFGDELRIQGWFLSHDELRRRPIVFDDRSVSPVPIDQTNLERGVWQFHGQIFGEGARRSRFYTARKVPEGDLTSARLRAETSQGLFEMWLGAPENMAPAARFSPEDSALVMQFESIGDNCEFGLMQRVVGTERMSLMRYAGVGDVVRFANLIDRRFEGFCEGDDLQITTLGPEWIADVRSGGLHIHTGRIQGLVSREKIQSEERQKLQFLANKLLDDLEGGTKTFVYRTLRHQRGGPNGTYGMDELYRAMARCGSCTLLWVNEADDAHTHGTIRHVRDNLFRGYIRRLTPYHNAHDSDEQAWLELLSNMRAQSRQALSHNPADAETEVV